MVAPWRFKSLPSPAVRILIFSQVRNHDSRHRFALSSPSHRHRIIVAEYRFTLGPDKPQNPAQVADWRGENKRIQNIQYSAKPGQVTGVLTIQISFEQ